MIKMHTALFSGVKKIEIKDFTLPGINENEILLKVGACGVCGTDFNIFEGKAPANPPVILGHEYAGEIVEIGKNVKEFNVGERVAVNPNIHCGYCKFCKAGKVNLCKNLIALGVTINGGFAEYSVVPVSQAYKIPSDLPYSTATFAEPLSCCIHGIQQAEVGIGDKVAIVGAGPIGLIMLQLAKLSGASSTIIIDPVLEKRNLAIQFGAEYSFNPDDEYFLQKLNDLFNGDIDVVIECAGNESAVKTSLEIVRKGGRVVIFGLADKSAKVNLYLQTFFHKEITIKSSLLNPFTFHTAVELLSSGKINVKDFNPEIISLNSEGIQKIFYSKRDHAILKYMVIPTN